MVLGLVFGGFFTYVYKPIGLAVHMSDFLLSWAASFAALTQAVTRVGVGFLYDKFGFRTIFIGLMIINIVNSLIAYEARYNETLYFACIQMNYLVLAGIFALFPTPVAKTFGPKFGAQVYTMVMFASPIKSIISMIGIKFLEQKIGIPVLLYSGAVSALIAFIICLFFTEKLDVQRMHKKSLLVWKPRPQPLSPMATIKRGWFKGQQNSLKQPIK